MISYKFFIQKTVLINMGKKRLVHIASMLNKASLAKNNVASLLILVWLSMLCVGNDSFAQITGVQTQLKDEKIIFSKGGIITAQKTADVPEFLFGNRKSFKIHTNKQKSKLYEIRPTKFEVSSSSPVFGFLSNALNYTLFCNESLPNTKCKVFNITPWQPYKLVIPTANRDHLNPANPKKLQKAVGLIGDYFKHYIAVTQITGNLAFNARESITDKDGNVVNVNAGKLNIQDGGAPFVVWHSDVSPNGFVVQQVLANNKRNGYVGIGTEPAQALHIRNDLVIGDNVELNLKIGEQSTVNKAGSANDSVSGSNVFQPIATQTNLDIVGDTGAEYILVATAFAGLQCRSTNKVKFQIKYSDGLGDTKISPETTVGFEGGYNEAYPIGASLVATVSVKENMNPSVTAEVSSTGCSVSRVGGHQNILTVGLYPQLALEGVKAMPLAEGLSQLEAIKKVAPKGELPGLYGDQLVLGSKDDGVLYMKAMGNSLSFLDKNQEFATVNLDVSGDLATVLVDEIKELYNKRYFYKKDQSGMSPPTNVYKFDSANGVIKKPDEVPDLFYIGNTDAEGEHDYHAFHNGHLLSFSIEAIQDNINNISREVTANMTFKAVQDDKFQQSYGGSFDFTKNQGKALNALGLVFSGKELNISNSALKVTPKGVYINNATPPVTQQDPNKTVLKIDGNILVGGEVKGNTSFTCAKVVSENLTQQNAGTRTFSKTVQFSGDGTAICGSSSMPEGFYQFQVFSTIPFRTTATNGSNQPHTFTLDSTFNGNSNTCNDPNSGIVQYNSESSSNRNRGLTVGTYISQRYKINEADLNKSFTVNLTVNSNSSGYNDRFASIKDLGEADNIRFYIYVTKAGGCD